ncbi:hypothetical protein GCM10023189_19960 [Nibrella saemangeumensis]|uniref:Uncharacterized protein n=1 Tax=Nibrella saemangeumensis TaxID=1084526 RepID=A0ABP8MPF9_9BACT
MLLLSIGGFYGGVSFLTDPSGRSLGMAPTVVQMLPVANLFLPGLFLVITFGIAPFMLTYALLAKPRWALAEAAVNDMPYHWAWAASVGLSALLIIWIVVQFGFIGYQFPVQPITGLWGVLLLGLLLLPSVRRHCAI